jgi:hypothetical protein
MNKIIETYIKEKTECETMDIEDVFDLVDLTLREERKRIKKELDKFPVCMVDEFEEGKFYYEISDEELNNIIKNKQHE